MPYTQLSKGILGLSLLTLTGVMSAQAVTLLESTHEWSYQEGNATLPSDWYTLDYDDSTWDVGNGGIGYGDNDDSTVLLDVKSVFMRQEFTIHNLEEINGLSLFGSFDDGFVAYLNGVEIARSNVSGQSPSYTTSADHYKEAELTQGQRPSEYVISGDMLTSLLSAGTNLLAIQTHNFGDDSSDLSSNYWLIGTLEQESDLYFQLPDWYETGVGGVESFDSDIPIVKITSSAVIVDEPKVQATVTIIHDPNDLPNNSNDLDSQYSGNIAIEKRGQSSLFFFPKHGYGFETKDSLWEDIDAEILGLPAEEDWVLHGPYSDKTLLRNVVAMDIANEMDQYASRTQPVELIINEQYQGIYILMEKIKRDKNRVDIAKLTEADTVGIELTGGYVFKIDKGVPDWNSIYPMSGIPDQLIGYQYVSPNRNKILPQQEEYIQSYVDSFEIALRNPAYNYGGKSINQYIDINSFADHYIMGELTKNVDAFRISTYLHKEKDTDGGLLKMGPVWDFNLGFGNADYCDGWSTDGSVLDIGCASENPFWWQRLLEYGPFDNAVRCRYEVYRNSMLQDDQLEMMIDSHAVSLTDQARQRDDQQWMAIGQYVWPNPFVGKNYDQELTHLKMYILDRLEYLDEVWGQGCILSDTEEIDDLPQVIATPNPASRSTTVIISNHSEVNAIQLNDMIGHRVLTQSVTTDRQKIDISGLFPGLYVGSVIGDDSRIVGRFKIIVE